LKGSKNSSRSEKKHLRELEKKIKSGEEAAEFGRIRQRGRRQVTNGRPVWPTNEVNLSSRTLHQGLQSRGASLEQNKEEKGSRQRGKKEESGDRVKLTAGTSGGLTTNACPTGISSSPRSKESSRNSEPKRTRGFEEGSAVGSKRGDRGRND